MSERQDSTLKKKYPKISKLDLDKSPLKDNPWLSGFIDADGNFFCSFNLNTAGKAERVKSYMRISQKRIYKSTSSAVGNSNFKIMDKIREFLQVKNVNLLKRTHRNYTELSYEVRTTKKASCNLLIDYLSVYPLFSSKYQDFLD